MNINKFTQKSIQAVNNLEKIAYEYGNQEIEEEHLLYCLLNQEDSLILKLIEKMEINKDEFQRFNTGVVQPYGSEQYRAADSFLDCG